MFIVVDTETTGLGDDDLLLEVGCICTNDDLETIGSISLIIGHNKVAVEERMNPFVTEMHTSSGLLDMIPSGFAIPAAEQALVRWLTELNVPAGEVPMTGSTIDFDRGVLKRNMPKFNDYFHYRSINVSSVKELVRRWLPDAVYPPNPDKAHRVLSDCENTIAELRHYREVLFR